MPAPIPDLNRDHECHFYQAPSGQRCGSPALKGEYYCYHHHITNVNRKNRRVLIDPEVTCMEIPPIEDSASIFIALAAVVHRLAENTIDTRRAGQMIYSLQVALQVLPPAPAPKTQPAAQTKPAAQTQPASEQSASTSSTSIAPCQHPAAQPATDNPQPATRTIPVSKESLLYFLRSRHCANCNAELFPDSELTQRRNPGAPPEVVEEARPALPAPEPATDNLQPATVLSTLHAVAEDPGPETSNRVPRTWLSASFMPVPPPWLRNGPAIHIQGPLCFTLS
jgi:hypothetical protein